MDKKIKKQIFKKIADTVDEYLSSGMNISAKNLKKYFNNSSNLKNLISDINNFGEEKFDNKEEYVKNIKLLLNDILNDRLAYELDKNKTTGNKKSYGVIESYVEFLDKKNDRLWI